MTKLEIRLRDTLKQILPYVPESHQQFVRNAIEAKRGNSVPTDRIIELLESGCRVEAIANSCNCSTTTVYKILHEAGFKHGRTHGNSYRLTRDAQ